MPFCQHNIPSEQVTLSHPLTNIPPITLADTPKTPAYTAIIADVVLNIACYIKIIACYIKIIVVRTAIIAGGSKNIACNTKNIACYTKIIACYTQNIASRTLNIDNYIASDVSSLAHNATNTSKTSSEL